MNSKSEKRKSGFLKEIIVSAVENKLTLQKKESSNDISTVGIVKMYDPISQKWVVNPRYQNRNSV
jgi:hypothetical protein